MPHHAAGEIDEARGLNLAVVALAHDQGGIGGRIGGMGTATDLARAVVPGEAAEGRLGHLHEAGAGVVARLGRVPLPGAQGLARGEELIAHSQAEIAGGPDDEGEARIAPAAADQDLLLPCLRSCRPDIGAKDEALEPVEGGGRRYNDAGAGANWLTAAGVIAIDASLHGLGLEARTLRPVVAADEAQDLDAIPSRSGLAAHLEFDGFSGPDRHAVGIADDLQHAEPVQSRRRSWPVCRFQRSLKTAHSASAVVSKTGPSRRGSCPGRGSYSASAQGPCRPSRIRTYCPA